MKALVPASGLAAWRAFLEAHSAAVGGIEGDLADAGLIPFNWYDVLVAIQLAPDHRLRMMDIAGRLMLTRSNATRLIDRLQTVGLIERERTDGDRRGTVAKLSADGRQALRRAWPVYARGIREYFLAALTPEEQRVMTRALTRVHERAHPSRRPLTRRRLSA